ncbi:hypothetical protein GQ53DRAFT_882918 [Thozetella sp. PMI_491]|nr:hypothetical protein GQ53DRAFT_882918 [Thozetella sp. PMI_491]
MHNGTAPGFPPGFAEESNGHMIIIPCAVFLALCPIAVGIRVWTRLYKLGYLGSEDWVLLLALVELVIVDGLSINLVQLGMGHHFRVLMRNPENLSTLRMRFWLSQIFYKLCLQTTKISLLLLYKRIFGSVFWFKRLMIGSIILLGAYLFASVMGSILQCLPTQSIWDMSVKGTCINILSFFLFNAYFATITDFIVLLYPVPLLVGLKIPFAQKLSLIPVFGLGIVAATVSAMRLASFYLPVTMDSTFFDLTGQMWTLIEVNLTVLCAALPAVRTLLAHMFPKKFGTMRSKTSTVALESKKWNSAGWSRVDDRNAISLTNIKYGDTSSEALSGDLQRQQSGGGIQKTMGYRVEYE